MSKKPIIVFEGIDCSGKSVHSNNAANYLKKKGIFTSVYYPHPVPRLKFYRKKYKLKLSNYKVSCEFSDRIICFPIGPHINKNSLDFLYNTFSEAIKKYK